MCPKGASLFLQKAYNFQKSAVKYVFFKTENDLLTQFNFKTYRIEPELEMSIEIALLAVDKIGIFSG